MPNEQLDMIHKRCLTILIGKNLQQMLLECPHPFLHGLFTITSKRQYLPSTFWLGRDMEQLPCTGQLDLAVNGCRADFQKTSGGSLMNGLMLGHGQQQGK